MTYKRDSKGRFVKGHKRKRESIKKGIETRRKNGTLKHSKKTRLKMSRTRKRLTLKRKQLYNLYIIKRLSTIKISKIFGCSTASILNYLKKYNIKTRTISLANKGKIGWSKGLTKETDERVKKISNSKKGKMFSKQHKQKLKLAHIGKLGYWSGKKRPEVKNFKNFGFKKGCISYNKGLTKETDKSIRIGAEKRSKILRILHKKGILKPTGCTLLKGKNHPHFNNWSSREPYGKEFSPQLKEFIRNKYGRKCVECHHLEKQLGYKLHIHHIDFNKQNNKFNNLVPLCRACHSQTNFNRVDWTKYFQNITKNKI